MKSKGGSSKRRKRAAQSRDVDDAHHIARVVFKNCLKRDAQGRAIGVLYTAFLLRRQIQEKYLSSSCMEIAAAGKVAALTELKRRYSPIISSLSQSAFTIGNVQSIKSTCAPRSRIGVKHEPKPWNSAYTAVRNYYDDRLDLLELLATDSWADWTLVSDIP